MSARRKYTAKDFHPGYCLPECYDDKSYPDAQFCRGGKRKRRFPKNLPRYAPGWCPKRTSLKINIYTKYEVWHWYSANPDYQYVLCYTIGTDLKAYDFFKCLNKRETDLYDLLDGYYPKDDDIFEMDNGLVNHSVRKENGRWEIASFLSEKEKADRGMFGNIQVKMCPNSLQHYCSEESRYNSIVKGYFGGKKHLSWEGSIEGDEPSKEFEQICHVLETEGFLKDYPSLLDFCTRRSAVCKSDGLIKAYYCFYVDGKHATYYFQCRPDQDENYQVIVFVHRIL